MAEISDLNVTDGSNTARFPEGQNPSTVNNGARALEGMIARWFADINGTVAVAGTDTYTATINADTGFSLYDGYMFCGDFANANTGAATLNLTPDGGSALGAASIVKNGSAALVSGDIAAGQKVVLRYDGTNFQMLSPSANQFGLGDANTWTAAQTFTGPFVWTKGGDIASASPLVIDTDGNYFDVTGTTGFSQMTVAAGRFFALQFDGALTMTDGANLDLGGSDITTAAGDRALFYAVAANTAQLQSYFTEGAARGIAYPRGYRFGGTLSNNGTDADHDIDITAGAFRGADDDENIDIGALTRQIDVAFGTGNGGLSSSLTLTADTCYHVHAVNVSGAGNVGFDTSVTAANLIADHSATAYRRLGSVYTDGSSNIIAFEQAGDVFLLDQPILDYNSTIGTTATAIGLTVPTGVRVQAYINAYQTKGGSVDHSSYFRSPDVSDMAPSTTAAPLASYGINSAAPSSEGGQAMPPILTNTSGQIEARSLQTTVTLRVATVGWRDFLGD